MRTTSLFFHPEINGKKASRLTFSISPVRDGKGTLINLLVGTAVCKMPDVFCKKTGRVVAMAKDPVSCTIHTLPAYVAKVMNSYQKELIYTSNDFAWLSLRFI